MTNISYELDACVRYFNNNFLTNIMTIILYFIQKFVIKLKYYVHIFTDSKYATEHTHTQKFY